MNLLPVAHGALALLLLTPAFAQDRREHGREAPRVILYENAGFRGGALILGPGDTLDNLERERFHNGRRANDRISSVRIEGDAEVLLCSDAYFRGETLRVTHDLANLDGLGFPGHRQTWNDRISSVRVVLRRPGHPPGHGPGPGPVAPHLGDPDKVVRRAYQDILQREPDPAGLRTYRSRIIDQGWTEVMVRDALRRSDEYRGPVVNGMIERAYQELLGRKPDPRGLDHYRNQIIDKGMTEDGLREDLRRSDEYRNRGRNPPPPVPPPAPRPGARGR